MSENYTLNERMTESAVECSSMGNSRRPFFLQRARERGGKGEREGGTGGFRGGGLVLECMAAGSEDATNLFDTSTILRLSASCLASPELGAGRVTGSDLLRVLVSVRWDSCESIGDWDVCCDSTFLASFDE